MIRNRIFLFLLMLALVSPLMADDVTIDFVSGNWQNYVGGSSVNINPGGNTTAPDSIYWGTPASNDGQSGYKWDSRGDADSASFTVSTGTAFSLGEFTHMNRPIYGDAISSVQLAFQVGTFSNPPELGATFLFSHDETTNETPCAYFSTSPCADRVTISNAFLDAPFIDNGKNYYFTLLGFSTDEGKTFSANFVTQERQDNTADLYAIVTTSPTAVPEPTSLLLLGTGLGMAGLVTWRKRK